MKSVIQTEKKCFACGQTYGLELHHVFFGTANREQSEKYGMTIWLTPFWHRDIRRGIHFDRAFDLQVKQFAQRKFEETHTHDEFMKIFGRNYL